MQNLKLLYNLSEGDPSRDNWRRSGAWSEIPLLRIEICWTPGKKEPPAYIKSMHKRVPLWQSEM